MASYGTHKLMMEELCRSYAANFGLKVALPRLFSVYGPWLKKQLLWDLCNKIVSNRKIELGGTGDERRDWVDVRDVTCGLEKLENFSSVDAPVVNLASGKATTVREVTTILVEKWIAAGGSSRRVDFSGRSRPGDPFSLIADVQRMGAMGIMQGISIDQGIADYVTWFRTQIGGAT
jgi:UDP-glucose 4-epimerase